MPGRPQKKPKKKNNLIPSNIVNKVKSKFTETFSEILEKSGFGDCSGNCGGGGGDVLVVVEDKEDYSAVYIFLIIYMLLVLFYGFKSISMLCPGAWDGNGVKWILLLLLFMTGGNIGVVYIIMAYAFDIKICK